MNISISGWKQHFRARQLVLRQQAADRRDEEAKRYKDAVAALSFLEHKQATCEHQGIVLRRLHYQTYEDDLVCMKCGKVMA